MGKKQNKTKQEPVLSLDGNDYNIEDLSDDQKTMVAHIADLNRKIESTQFNLTQLTFGRQAFIDNLKSGLE